MTDPAVVRKEFEAFVDRVAPVLPKAQKVTFVVTADYFDRYETYLGKGNRWHDVGTPAQNLLWDGHIVVRGDAY